MSGLESSTTSNLVEYRGNCHCGAFRFLIKSPQLKHVKTCNCSICIRNGYIWIFPVPDENFSIEKGEGILKEYEFGKKAMTHMFCPICGTSVMARRKNVPKGKAIGINARALKDIDLDTLEFGIFKGADLEPVYEPPVSSSLPEQAENGQMLYHGSCHCGAVTYTVTTTPLSETKVMSCNCSLCSRNGDLWIYPKKEAVNIHGADALTGYAFLSNDSLHSFCKICGISMVVRAIGDDEDHNICPINVRTIAGVQVDQLTLQTYDGRKNDPQYVLRN